MPELCRFYGVRIKMHYDGHNPPHFHAEHGGDEALISIDTLEVIAGGQLPFVASVPIATDRRFVLRALL